MLVRTPAPLQTESLFGYVLRISEANGYDTPWHVFNHAGLSQGEMNSPAIPIEKLTAVIGTDPLPLKRIAYADVNSRGLREYFLLGHSLGRSTGYAPLRLTKPSFCPHCVVERGYIDAFWDLSIAVACPVHRCAPITHCPSCGEILSRFRPGLLTCKCRASLAAGMPGSVEPALAELMAVIWAKLHNSPVDTVATQTGLPVAELMGMSLRSLLIKLPGLGRFSVNPQDRERDWHALTSSAAQTLSDWPRNFRSLLHRVGHANADAGIGYRKRFEPFYSKFASNRISNGDCRWLRDAFLRYGLEEWDLSIVDNKLLRDEPAARRFVTKSELSRHLKLSATTIRKWANKGHIPLKQVHTSSKGLRYIADLAAEEMTAPLRSDKGILETRKAAAYLGIPVRVLSFLKRKGHLSVLHMSKHKQGYHQADLDRFREKLLALSPLVTTDSLMKSGITLVSLEHALRKFNFYDHDRKAGFLVSYLHGEFVSAGRTGDTLADIKFNRSEVLTHVSASRVDSACRTLLQGDAAKIIGCCPLAISGLISQGFLTSVQLRKSLRVSSESLEQFAERYVPLATLAKEIGTSSPRLHRLCQQGKIPILYIVKRHGYPATFIEKSYTEPLRQLSVDLPVKRKSKSSTRSETDA